MPNVFIMIGFPGSGKSTYIKNHLNNFPIVSRDVARIELGFCSEGEKYLGTKEEENMVTSYCDGLLTEYAQLGVDFVIDNTHLRKKYRQDIIDKVKPYGYRINYIYMYVDTNTCVQRRKQDGFGDKAEEIIERMRYSFDCPSKEECDYLTIVFGGQFSYERGDYQFTEFNCTGYDERLHIYNDKGVYVYKNGEYLNSVHNIAVGEISVLSNDEFNDFLTDCELK